MSAALNTSGSRLRKKPGYQDLNGTAHANNPSSASSTTASDAHPLGESKHGIAMQLLRIVAFTIYFFGSGIVIHLSQLLGCPLYFIDKDWFYAYMALTKQYFGLLAISGTQLWSATVIRVSGDKSMAGLITLKGSKEDGGTLLEVDFGERIVMMANHQIYTEWLYLWWVAYTNKIPMHGHLYIMLKESLKWVPLIGPAMQFYGFIFMARKWAQDQERIRHRLQKLNSQHAIPGHASAQGSATERDPVWLLIFPEGTNLSANTRDSSARYAVKAGIPDMKHTLLPRSTGLQFCLQELKDTVPYLYDCTIGYAPIPPGAYGQDIYTLRSVYFQGRPPRSVNLHWRRFAIKDIPYNDAEQMSEWMMQRWREKDELLEQFVQTGRFPADPEGVQIEAGGKGESFIETEVKTRTPFEFFGIFAPLAAAALLGRIGVQIIDRVIGTKALF